MRRLVEIMSAWGDCDYGHNSLIDFVYNGMKAITRALPLTVVLKESEQQSCCETKMSEDINANDRGCVRSAQQCANTKVEGRYKGLLLKDNRQRKDYRGVQ